jgi:hypothetical protein
LPYFRYYGSDGKEDAIEFLKDHYQYLTSVALESLIRKGAILEKVLGEEKGEVISGPSTK